MSKEYLLTNEQTNALLAQALNKDSNIRGNEVNTFTKLLFEVTQPIGEKVSIAENSADSHSVYNAIALLRREGYFVRHEGLFIDDVIDARQRGSDFWSKGSFGNHTAPGFCTHEDHSNSAKIMACVMMSKFGLQKKYGDSKARE